MHGSLSKFGTKKFVLAILGMGVSSAALWMGKMDGATWVYAFAVVLAGHHAEDLVKAWKHDN